MASRTIRYVRVVDAADATGLVAQVYLQIRRDFQLGPPLVAHSSDPEILAGVWSMLRESLLAAPADRTLRAAIGTAVSRINVCPYCVEVFSMMMHARGAHATARAVAAGRLQDVDDPRIASVVAWAEATRLPGTPTLASIPFSPGDAPQMMATAVLFHYMNRLANVLLDELPVPMPRAALGLLPLVRRAMAATFGRRVMRLHVAPGAAVPSQAEAPPVPEFQFASSNPHVHRALASLAVLLDRRASVLLPAPVMTAVQTRIRRWDGTDMPMGRHWVEDDIAGIERRFRPAARLALLTALASHQVDSTVVDEYRQRDPDDASLVGIVSWASFTAARRIASWFP